MDNNVITDLPTAGGDKTFKETLSAIKGKHFVSIHIHLIQETIFLETSLCQIKGALLPSSFPVGRPV